MSPSQPHLQPGLQSLRLGVRHDRPTIDLYLNALPELSLPEWASLPRRTHHDLYDFYKDNDYNPEDPSDMPKGPSMASLEKYGYLFKRICINYDEKRFFVSKKTTIIRLWTGTSPSGHSAAWPRKPSVPPFLPFAQRSRPSKSASLKAVAGTAHTMAGVDRPGSDTRTREPSCGRKTVLWLD